MGIEDYEFATDLANTMNWNMAPEDFEFNASLEPGGCFVALNDSLRIGIATCIRFGKIGWFGNLIVKEEYRKHGVGSLLVNHALGYLKSKEVESVGLYAYPNLINFYGHIGFKRDVDFSLLSIEKLGKVTAKTLLESGTPHIKAIEQFDARYFGGDRKRLLESIILEKGNLSFCTFENGKLSGYVAATVYEKMAWIGPLICKIEQIEDAKRLISSVLMKLSGLSVYLVMPKSETAVKSMLFEMGFIEEFSVSCMYFGQFVSRNCIYLAESLERG